jgi:SAM-dependent methyltransferase
MTMDEYMEVNRGLWEGWTQIHERTAFYDVPGFLRGASTLTPIEREEVGDVAGLDLLHLQCHFGLDTLSWARHGAHVTGVDFSDRAITLARSLAHQTRLEARFVQSNVLDLPADFDGRFDIVFTSWGVLCWLPYLDRWARGIARCLRPGGRFHIAEFHPIACMFDDDGINLRYPYFRSKQPLHARNRGSYADPDAEFSHDSFEWTHTLGDTVGALISAGLAIRSLREYPFSPWNCLPHLEEREPGRWYATRHAVDLPLAFSICAVRAGR